MKISSESPIKTCVKGAILTALLLLIVQCKVKVWEKCENHNECCSGTCVTFTFKCAPNANYYRQSSLDRSALQTLINGLFASTERPANYSLPTPGLNSRFGEDEATAPPAQSPPPASAVNPDCKEIGEKCYRDSECCTNRCHGFLHQCVT
ncbi:uncharacterized protein LOC119658013 isoform X2 [Hermetia illucens]|uniref:uncharacterized protein LOC119658013 isoform X2 n=1 Tax=Hermetia illucens TaxID=343691 RepID=UPI0018CC6F49|nr:uncharacterized protein LOC119658013 isoform X2 [Hermetia illucens]